MVGDHLAAVPGPRGVDHLRVMEQAARYSNEAVRQLHLRYGNAFVFGFGPIRFHWLIGPEANRFILAEAASSFVQRRAYAFLQPIGGDHALIVSDEPDHLPRRRLVQPAFHRRHLEGWCSGIERRFERHLERLADRDTVDVHDALRPVVLEIIAEILLGTTMVEAAPAWLDDVRRMMRFANQPFLAQLFKVDLPGTPWRSFVRARRRVDATLFGEIERRREHGAGADVLDLLVAARDETGAGLSDLEIRDQAVSLVAAGFDTTSAALAWALYGLLEHPEILAALREEVDTATRESWLGLPLLDAVVKETLRLYPPASAGLRETREAIAFGGYHLPAGARVAFSIYLTQRDPAVFEDPLTFRPARWLGAPAPSAYSYLPFGHGARYCIGGALATTTIKLGLAVLLSRYTVRGAYPSPVEESGVTLQPRGGLRVALRRR